MATKTKPNCEEWGGKKKKTPGGIQVKKRRGVEAPKRFCGGVNRGEKRKGVLRKKRKTGEGPRKGWNSTEKCSKIHQGGAPRPNWRGGEKVIVLNGRQGGRLESKRH